MEPIFSEKPAKTEKQPAKAEPQKNAEEQKPKLRKLSKNISSPSIKNALSGKAEGEQNSAKEQHEAYNGKQETEDFTEPEFVETWGRYLTTIDSPNLKTTLSSIPEFDPSYRFVLKIENTVQEDNVRNIKPDLVTFLRKELKNSKIEVVTKIVEKKGKTLVYSDDEKYTEMVSKNPDLKLLRQKFNLDFGE